MHARDALLRPVADGGCLGAVPVATVPECEGGDLIVLRLFGEIAAAGVVTAVAPPDRAAAGVTGKYAHWHKVIFRPMDPAPRTPRQLRMLLAAEQFESATADGGGR